MLRVGLTGGLGSGKSTAAQRFAALGAHVFSADETEDVGEDLATPVTEDYKEGDNKFTGTIENVTIAVTPPPAQVTKDEESGDAIFQEGVE